MFFPASGIKPACVGNKQRPAAAGPSSVVLLKMAILTISWLILKY
jgi:hypothetical protein